MGYYYVLEKEVDSPNLLLEDLSTAKRLNVEFNSIDVCVQDSNEKSQILRILPSEFFLSPFTNGKVPYVFDGNQVLFNISAAMIPFSKRLDIKKECIIELADWVPFK